MCLCLPRALPDRPKEETCPILVGMSLGMTKKEQATIQISQETSKGTWVRTVPREWKRMQVLLNERGEMGKERLNGMEDRRAGYRKKRAER